MSEIFRGIVQTLIVIHENVYLLFSSFICDANVWAYFVRLIFFLYSDSGISLKATAVMLVACACYCGCSEALHKWYVLEHLLI